jgi:hypothetical protein
MTLHARWIAGIANALMWGLVVCLLAPLLFHTVALILKACFP